MKLIIPTDSELPLIVKTEHKTETILNLKSEDILLLTFLKFYQVLSLFGQMTY